MQSQYSLIIQKKLNEKVKKLITKSDDKVEPKAGGCYVPFVNIPFSVDYELQFKLNYSRYSPNLFRYYDYTLFPTYNDEVVSLDPNAECLRYQLKFGTIKYWSTEVIFLLIVPQVGDSETTIKFRDNIRNEFIAFCLNIEKSYIYYNNSRLTCNNTKVPWDCFYDWQLWYDQDAVLRNKFLYGQSVPLVQLDQYVMYSLAANYFSFDRRYGSKNPINAQLIMDVNNGVIPLDSPLLTQVNFYEIISWTFSLLSYLFSVSSMLLQGSETGLPPDFIAAFFPKNRQLYYYNLYITWTQSRNGYFGFGDKINSSNGDATNIQIPNGILNTQSF